jgi:tRNA/rRNA methyltransferase
MTDLYFVLVEPAVPENIGAAARAIKTMGFKYLRLVNPSNHLADKAKWLAHASNEILEQAQLYSTLEEAISDLDFVIGTTAKQRSVAGEYISSRNLDQFMSDKEAAIQKTGIVFGREESGLSNEELNICDIASYVPIDSPYPSINLAQSVMIYAYALSSVSEREMTARETKAPEQSYRKLSSRIQSILISIGIEKGTMLSGRIMERISMLTEGDIRLLHSISSKLLEKESFKE